VTQRRSKIEQRGRRHANRARLVYVDDFEKGLTRVRCGKGFTYRDARGRTITAERTRRRIEALAIPPAWEDVWICSRSNGHVQATGRDAAGRLQRIYHERWQAIAESTKFDRLILVAEQLPRIRRRVRRDLDGRRPTRTRVLAAVVRTIDRGHVRVGNERSADEHGSHGATTLTSDDVAVSRFTISLDYPGKSGQRQEVEFTDAKVAKVIRQCEQLDGQFLFSYLDGDGEPHRVDSGDVNDYLRDITDESITAKDFRTWAGSVIALAELRDLDEEASRTERRKRVVAAVCAASEALGNTVAICRKSYVHPGLLAAAESGELPALVARARRSSRAVRELTADELLLARLLPKLTT
jgi:DNA topoisomerase I